MQVPSRFESQSEAVRQKCNIRSGAAFVLSIQTITSRDILSVRFGCTAGSEGAGGGWSQTRRPLLRGNDDER